MHVKVLLHNLKFSRSSISVGVTTFISVVYRLSIELPFLNCGRADLRIHQYNADDCGLGVASALGMSILPRGNKTQAMPGDFPQCRAQSKWG